MENAASKSSSEIPNTPTQPLEGLMRKREVLALLQCNAVTLWRMCRDKRFPPPLHITPRAIGWRRADVYRWIRDLK